MLITEFVGPVTLTGEIKGIVFIMGEKTTKKGGYWYAWNEAELALRPVRTPREQRNGSYVIYIIAGR